MRLRNLSFLALPLLAWGCPSSSNPPMPPLLDSKDEPREDENLVVRPSISGLGFRMTELEAGTGNSNKLAKVVPLPDGEANKLLARLPRFEGQPDDQKEFALRDKSQPPPRTSKTITQTFPPPSLRPSVPAPQPGPLKVLRRLPEGDVSFAPHLSVTFSQPMIPVTSHGDLAGKPPPVKLTPHPPGNWRWIGTKTLLFEPEKRFPMATEFTVEIPAGIRSENGEELASAEIWKFRTPPLKMTGGTPQGGWGQKLDVMMRMSFDQAVEAEAILKHLKVTAGGGPLGGSPIPVRLATPEELEKNAEARSLLAKAETRDRHVFFRSVEPLPRDTSIQVTLPQGAPSAEGPRKSEVSQGFSFRTFGPMLARNASCGWGDGCSPLAPFQIQFSNQIEASRFDKAQVTIEPPLEDVRASVSHSTLTIQGRTRGRTTYKITLSPEIADVHGQRLEGTRTFEIRVGSAKPILFPEERPMAILDPEGSPTLPVYSVNQREARGLGGVSQVSPRLGLGREATRATRETSGEPHPTSGQPP
ncbi:MAG: Ig-like domain-containing protein [Myxococcales bacterium]|nr:Ig-like domain-containing protein [Polyangiaceae bacterium]MDW8249445.1 Ig-like domain-containing protein [Myxococcales bacterium]